MVESRYLLLGRAAVLAGYLGVGVYIFVAGSRVFGAFLLGLCVLVFPLLYLAWRQRGRRTKPALRCPSCGKVFPKERPTGGRVEHCTSCGTFLVPLPAPRRSGQ